MTQYKNRDIMSDELSDHYAKHVFAMTSEGLHSKSDIAAELAYRDMVIDLLKVNLNRSRDCLKVAGNNILKIEKERDECRERLSRMRR